MFKKRDILLGSISVNFSSTKGEIHLKPPNFEHIFVAVITFPPFFLYKYFWYQLVAYCVYFKMIYI